MSSSKTLLRTDSPLIQAMVGVLQDVEKDLDLKAPIDAYLAGGMAVYLYTPSRVTTDIDLEFNVRKIAITKNFTREAVLEDGSKELVFLDTNYNSTYAMLHDRYQEDSLPVETSLKMLRLHVLSPVDLAVSKIARFHERDQMDIRSLAEARLFTSEELRTRVQEAVANYVGNHDSLQTSINLAVRLVEGVEVELAARGDNQGRPEGGAAGGNGIRFRI